MSEPFLPYGPATFGVWTLEATALLFVTWLITLLYRKNAALRHLTWLTALVALLLIPAVSLVMPVRLIVRVPLPAPMKSLQAPFSAPHQSAVATSNRTIRSSADEIMLLAPQPDRRHETARASRSRRSGMSGMPGLLLVLWLTGVMTVMLQGIAALYGIRRLRRCSVPDAFSSLDLPDLAARVGLKRRWELRVSTTSALPAAMTWGCAHPVVLLPRDAHT